MTDLFFFVSSPGKPSEQLQQPLDAAHHERDAVGVGQRHERDAGVHGQHPQHGRHALERDGHVFAAAVAATRRTQDAAARRGSTASAGGGGVADRHEPGQF